MTKIDEVFGTTSNEFVGVGLMPGIPQDDVVRGVEHAMESEGELDHPEVGAEMAAVGVDRFNDDVAHLGRERGELLGGEGLEVGRRLNRLNDHGRSPCRRHFENAATGDGGVVAGVGVRGATLPSHKG